MNWHNFQTIFFDLGDTLVYQKADLEHPLDQLKLELLPSVKKMLYYASQRCELGIITNTEITTEIGVWRCLKQLGIDSFIKSVTTSVTTGFKKPNRNIFLIALSKHHAEPRRSVMIGNNYEEDITPAKELGMTTILFDLNNKYERQQANFADYFAQDSKELLQLFQDWERA